MNKNYKISIIGQGYVGLPLAIEFSKLYPTIGYDINEKRILELNKGIDNSLEIENALLADALKSGLNIPFSKGYRATTLIDDIKDSNVFIVTVPTPIDYFKTPDLSFLKNATHTVASVLKKGDIVIYESTVYPGCTEEICISLLENLTKLTYNKDFFVGYSPERINPGDKINTLTKIKKVTSGSTPEIAKEIDLLYKSIIIAGTHLVSSIKVAEASKAIENAQRDINISFVNELALIFDKMKIDTNEVLDAAATKFNFLNFRPGLVGGHCISVDPYYLAYKSSQLGYYPEVILSGRRVNDQIASFIASKTIKLMISKDIIIKNSRVLLLGFSFKENCPDVRNTKVVDIYSELIQYGCCVDVYDPWADRAEVQEKYDIKLLKALAKDKKYQALILAVKHKEFKFISFEQILEPNAVVFDVKAFYEKNRVDARL